MIILNDLKEAPGDTLSFAEFGIGLNNGTTNLSGHSAFDEKVKGTCHIAIGMNQMFGGNNESPLHIDFVAKTYELTKKQNENEEIKMEKTIEVIANEFTNFLNELKSKKEVICEELKQKVVDDEMKHIKVELNVIEIFTKMFDISCKKALSEENKIESLKSKYIGFFDNIPKNWYISLEKHKKFGNNEEVFVEELKIEQMLLIKKRFLELL